MQEIQSGILWTADFIMIKKFFWTVEIQYKTEFDSCEQQILSVIAPLLQAVAATITPLALVLAAAAAAAAAANQRYTSPIHAKDVILKFIISPD